MSSQKRLENSVRSNKTLVIGLGNTIAGDDGIGIHVARELKSEINEENIDVLETYYSGLKLVDLMYGYDKVVVIDAFKNGSSEPGELELFDVKDHRFEESPAMLHNINFMSNYGLIRKTYPQIPDDIKIIGININDINSFKENLSSELKSKLPEITKRIIDILRS
jgi:hydrogenase maturation protease